MFLNLKKILAAVALSALSNVAFAAFQSAIQKSADYLNIQLHALVNDMVVRSIAG